MLDKLIRREIPGGRHIRRTPHSFAPGIDFTKLFCADHVDLERASLSIGTLGGGNHFIEVDVAGDGTLYIIVHSGSRHLGNQAALYYQNAGYEKLCEASASWRSAGISPAGLLLPPQQLHIWRIGINSTDSAENAAQNLNHLISKEHWYAQSAAILFTRRSLRL